MATDMFVIFYHWPFVSATIISFELILLHYSAMRQLLSNSRSSITDTLSCKIFYSANVLSNWPFLIGDIVKPETRDEEESSRLWCPKCAKRGHAIHDCPSKLNCNPFRFHQTDVPPNSVQVVSYDPLKIMSVQREG